MFECFAVASEEKILSGRRPQLAEAGNIGAKDEVLSFQAAYFSDVRINDLDVRTDGGTGALHLSVRRGAGRLVPVA